jgi:hypothetical protein
MLQGMHDTAHKGHKARVANHPPSVESPSPRSLLEGPMMADMFTARARPDTGAGAELGGVPAAAAAAAEMPPGALAAAELLGTTMPPVRLAGAGALPRPARCLPRPPPWAEEPSRYAMSSLADDSMEPAVPGGDSRILDGSLTGPGHTTTHTATHRRKRKNMSHTQHTGLGHTTTHAATRSHTQPHTAT